MKYKYFFLYALIYFILTIIISMNIAWTFLNDDEINIVKNSFNLYNNERIILIYNKPLRFKSNLAIIYIDSNGKIKFEERGYSDSYYDEQHIISKIRHNNFVKYLWYVDIINLIIILVIEYRKKIKTT